MDRDYRRAVRRIQSDLQNSFEPDTPSIDDDTFRNYVLLTQAFESSVRGHLEQRKHLRYSQTGEIIELKQTSTGKKRKRGDDYEIENNGNSGENEQNEQNISQDGRAQSNSNNSDQNNPNDPRLTRNHTRRSGSLPMGSQPHESNQSPHPGSSNLMIFKNTQNNTNPKRKNLSDLPPAPYMNPLSPAMLHILNDPRKLAKHPKREEVFGILECDDENQILKYVAENMLLKLERTLQRIRRKIIYIVSYRKHQLENNWVATDGVFNKYRVVSFRISHCQC